MVTASELPSPQVVYTPMDVVKERLQVQRVLGSAGAGNYAHFLDAYRTIAAKEGVRGRD